MTSPQWSVDFHLTEKAEAVLAEPPPDNPPTRSPHRHSRIVEWGLTDAAHAALADGDVPAELEGGAA